MAAASIVAAWSLASGLTSMSIVVPWWVDMPSVFGFYGLFFMVFDQWFWKVGFVRRLLKTPNLNGTYDGWVSSSFNQHSSRLDARLIIHQTWTKINIVMTTSNSDSQSQIASILTQDSSLSYEYLNNPHPNAPPTMQMHFGTAHMTFDSAGDALDGGYYSGRGRQNIGTLHFERVNRQ